MGAWGVGTFENDYACDFAAEVAASSSLLRVEGALDSILKVGNEYLEAPDACEALAAAEIVARLSGRSGEKSAYTEEIDKWVARIKLVPSSELLDKARRSVARITMEPSELLDLWTESEEGEAWKGSVNDLLARI